MKRHLLPERTYYKANLHAHSTVSDGGLTPLELKERYKAHGYSILAYTDHELLVDHSDLADPDFLPIDLVKSIYEENEGLDPLSKMSDVDIQVWLEGDIYLNVDKMSKAAGLEVRMPLTDLRIFDIASRMPSKYKVNSQDEHNKLALRKAASKILPEEIAYRKKLGFVVPIRMWMADDRYNGDVKRLFESEIAKKFFNIHEIKAIFDEYIGGNSDNWRKVYVIYTFLLWYETYFVITEDSI